MPLLVSWRIVSVSEWPASRRGLLARDGPLVLLVLHAAERESACDVWTSSRDLASMHEDEHFLIIELTMPFMDLSTHVDWYPERRVVHYHRY